MQRVLNIRNIDLNLLPILMVLLEEASVTAASKRIHLSQSATSSALRRIRETLNDPILIPDGKKMKLSPKARLIRQELASNLKSTAAVINKFVPVDLFELTSRVRISAPEHVLISIPELIKNIFSEHDEGIDMVLFPFCQNNAIRELEQEKTDLIIGAFGRLSAKFKRQTIYSESLVVFVREGHPAINTAVEGRISAESLRYFRHVAVSEDDAAEDSLLALILNRKGITRRMNAIIPSVVALPTILNNTDFISIGTRRAAEKLSDTNNLVKLKPPVELECDTFPIELIWCAERDDDHVIKTVREQIIADANNMPSLNSLYD